MITTEVFEPDDYCPHKVIYFRNEDDQCLRYVWLDKSNQIVKDYLCEFRSDGKLACIALYDEVGYDDFIVLKEFYYDRNGVLEGWCEFKNVNHEKKIICRTENIRNKKGVLEKVVFHDELNRPVGYQLCFDEGAEYGMLSGRSFNMNHEPVSDFGLERLF